MNEGPSEVFKLWPVLLAPALPLRVPWFPMIRLPPVRRTLRGSVTPRPTALPLLNDRIYTQALSWEENKLHDTTEGRQ